MLCKLCVFFRVCTLPRNNTAPCHKRVGNGKVYWIFTSSKPTLWLKPSRNCSGGWRGLVGGFSYYIKIFYQIYFIISLSFKNIKYISFKKIHIKKWKAWKCEALTNMYVNLVWLIINWPWKSKLPPSGEARKWCNLGTLKPKVPN